MATDERRLINGRDVYLRTIDSEFIGAAQPIQVNVADPVTAPNNSLGQRAVCKTDTRGQVLVVRMHKRAVVQAAVRCLEKRVSHRVKVGQDVITFPTRRSEFAPEAKIGCQLGVESIAVLYVREMLVLMKIVNEDVC